MARPRNFNSGRVVDGAMHEFWRNGFNATAVERLCAVMELSPGSLYGAFGGKRELFIAALDRYMDQISSDAIRRISAPASGMEGIRAYFSNLIDAIAEGRRARGCFLTNSLIELGQSDPEVSSKIATNLARLDVRIRIGAHESECRRRNRSRAGCEVGRLSCLLGAGAQCSGKYEAQPRFP